MDETIYKIAISGLLHDIGKFAERADIDVGEVFLNNNADLYQPYYNNHHTHKHAVYSAAFIEHYEKLLPKEFNKGGWGLDDPLINLAAGHHKPETPLQWIIAMADRISSGFDRDEFEDYNKGINVRDYKKTRLLTICEGISTDGKWNEDKLESFRYRYLLKDLSPNNIFPVDSDEYRSLDGEQASKEYKDLFFYFLDALEKLIHKYNIPLWFEHFDSLLMIYTSHIPAATVGKVVPDVSLYDHSRTTAALASALYLYHLHNNSMEIEKIRNYDDKKFLIVNGDFYGIQNFIFAEGGSTNKAAAKLLRGRSFAVSLISELAADLLCRKIGLTTVSIVLNAAGKFTVIAPNTKKTRQAITEVEDKVNKWLIGMSYGESSIGISFIDAACNDLVSNKFKIIWDSLDKKSERKKSSKVNLNKYGGAIDGYLNQFNNDLNERMCPFCGKRPSCSDVENDLLLGDRKSSCRLCRDHIYIGTNLVKTNRIAITTVDADLHGDKDKLFEPIFGEYQVSLDVEGKLDKLADKGILIKYWDISVPKEGRIVKDITAKFINGYVPKYTKDDEFDNRLSHGKKSEESKRELIDMINNGNPKSFMHIAKKALNQKEEDKFCGIEAIGVLKADVDNLGFIFACGLKRYSISRIATLSRQMNYYFSIYLPYILSTEERFNNIYTIFAGGDDLFVIGPWNRIVDFAMFLNRSFFEYVCRNNQITISAGISINKPGEPVRSFAERSEDALKKSKGNEKNSVTIFGESVKWAEFNELDVIKKNVEEWLNNSVINNAMLYRFNTFLHMAQQEKDLLRVKEDISLEEWECLKWKSMFKYYLIRNVGKKLSGNEKEGAIREAEKAANWFIQYGGAMKIPVWQIIYNQR